MNQNKEATPDDSKHKAPREHLTKLLLSVLNRSCPERKLSNQNLATVRAAGDWAIILTSRLTNPRYGRAGCPLLFVKVPG